MDDCAITLDEVLSGVTAIKVAGEVYPIAERPHSIRSAKYTSAIVAVGTITCPANSGVDSFRVARLEIQRTPAADEQAKADGETQFVQIPRISVIAPYMRPFGTTGDFDQNRSSEALTAAPFWMVFGLREGETPTALLSAERERVALDGLLKPSPGTEWTTPRPTTWPPRWWCDSRMDGPLA